jgi:exo-beta-1,3-glucanase (GH17 family)
MQVLAALTTSYATTCTPTSQQSVSDALANLEGYYNGMARSSQVGGKQLILGETGWPSGGKGKS